MTIRESFATSATSAPASTIAPSRSCWAGSRSCETERSPFAGEVSANAEATWVKPELVAEVKFAQRTSDGRLRAPVFLRLREDKPPEQVQRVEAVSAPRKAKSKNDDPPAADGAQVNKSDVDDVLEQLSRRKG